MIYQATQCHTLPVPSSNLAGRLSAATTRNVEVSQPEAKIPVYAGQGAALWSNTILLIIKQLKPISVTVPLATFVCTVSFGTSVSSLSLQKLSNSQTHSSKVPAPTVFLLTFQHLYFLYLQY